ncbi:MAG: stimulus-sensing domain-containing protein [Alphaproteobacteria bacterium]
MWRKLMMWLAQYGVYYRFTTISGRILALNFISVLVLVGGVLYLNDFRDDLIVARIGSLEVQAEIIARSIAQNSSVQTQKNVNARTDPLLAMQMAENSDEYPTAKPYKIVPERSAEVLRELIQPTRTPGYIYNGDGAWLADSSKILTHGQLVRFNQSVHRSDDEALLYRLWLRMEAFFRQESLPLFKDGGLDGKVRCRWRMV